MQYSSFAANSYVHLPVTYSQFQHNIPGLADTLLHHGPKIELTPLVQARPEHLRTAQLRQVSTAVVRTVLSACHRGLRISDVQNAVLQRCGILLPIKAISAIRRDQLHIVAAWRQRALCPVYVAVYFKSIRAKVRDLGNQDFHMAVGIRDDGVVELMGVWNKAHIEPEFWTRCMNDLKAHGVRDVLVAIGSEDSEYEAALHVAFPSVRTCPPVAELNRRALRRPSTISTQHLESLATLPPALRWLACDADPFAALIARLRRGGLNAHRGFRAVAEVLDLIVIILRPATVNWRVKPASWAAVEHDVQLHIAAHKECNGTFT